MELNKVSDEGGVLRLEAKGHVVQEALHAGLDPMPDLLGGDGYHRQVLLGMAGVDFVDSSGVSWMLAHHRRFRETGGKLLIHSLPPNVKEVLQVLRMDLVFHLAEDESAAMAMARGGNA
jgi:anti-anti-sigma factor